MAIEQVTRWRVRTSYVPDIDVYTDQYGVIVEQAERNIHFSKKDVEDVINAIRAAAESLPDDSDEIPF